jgi:hypothetical protein
MKNKTVNLKLIYITAHSAGLEISLSKPDHETLA